MIMTAWCGDHAIRDQVGHARDFMITISMMHDAVIKVPGRIRPKYPHSGAKNAVLGARKAVRSGDIVVESDGISSLCRKRRHVEPVFRQ